jgi:hypothetical protein
MTISVMVFSVSKFITSLTHITKRKKVTKYIPQLLLNSFLENSVIIGSVKFRQHAVVGVIAAIRKVGAVIALLMNNKYSVLRQTAEDFQF